MKKIFRTGKTLHLLGAAMLAALAISFSGCAAGLGYGGSGYYAPSYSSYYSDYGYGGEPYWGAGPYVGSTIVIGGRSHRGYYGGHHYARDWRGGGRSFRSGGYNRGGASGFHRPSGAIGAADHGGDGRRR